MKFSLQKKTDEIQEKKIKEKIIRTHSEIRHGAAFQPQTKFMFSFM